MTKHRTQTDKAVKSRGVGLLPSMLIIYISALIICISLTIIVFSLIGTSVYARLKAKEMMPQLRGITDAASVFLQRESDVDALFILTRVSDATLVILDGEGNEIVYHDPKQRENGPSELDPGYEPQLPDGMGGLPDGMGGQPDGMGGLPDGMGGLPDGMGGQQERPWSGIEDAEFAAIHKEYVDYCKEVYDQVLLASSNNEFSKYSSRLGVVVALPILSDGESIGAAYLIKPVNDLAESSKSVVYALVISAVAVSLLTILPIYIVTRWFISPIKKLTTASLALAEGDYSRRVEVTGSYEVQELGESFNTLADNLQANIGDLVVERNRLRAILDGMSEGIIGTDSSGEIVLHNNSAVLLLGGRDSAADVKELQTYAHVAPAVGAVLSGGEPVAENFVSGERTIRLSTSAIHEENGAIAGTVSLLMDITEAERLEQTRKDYVANVSHELRTPLASIRGIADMLNDGLVKNDNDRQRYYGYILKESIRLSTLINDLLELSRLQSGGVALQLRRVELYELAADVADRMIEPAAENGMTVELAMPEGKYYANTNADRIEQVMISLVDNAVKHGLHGGAVRIGIEPVDSKWNIFVENPANVDPQDIEHLFERFYKADTAHTGEGTGLGLAITEEVLRLMGERIWIDYDGSMIRFTFTAERENA
mgnify:CR=1 FL=1